MELACNKWHAGCGVFSDKDSQQPGFDSLRECARSMASAADCGHACSSLGLVQGNAPADVMQAGVSAVLGSNLIKQQGPTSGAVSWSFRLTASKSQSESSLVRQSSGRLSHLNKECLEILGRGPGCMHCLDKATQGRSSLLKGASRFEGATPADDDCAEISGDNPRIFNAFLPHRPMAQARDL